MFSFFGYGTSGNQDDSYGSDTEHTNDNNENDNDNDKDEINDKSDNGNSDSPSQSPKSTQTPRSPQSPQSRSRSFSGSRSNNSNIENDDEDSVSDAKSNASDSLLSTQLQILPPLPENYPLHYAVIKEDLKALEVAISKLEPITNPLMARKEMPINQRDHHGYSALHLAVLLSWEEGIDLLIKHDASGRIRSRGGWSAIQECISTSQRNILKKLYTHNMKHMREGMAKRAPIIRKKIAEKEDFYVEIDWKFTSWIPFVSRFCPSDTFRIWKHGSDFRIDITLIDFNQFKWERGHLSFVFKMNKKTDIIELYILNHIKKTKTVTTKSEEFEQDEKEIDEHVELLLQSELMVPEIISRNIQITPAKTWFGYNKTDVINELNCDFYDVANVVVLANKRDSHVPDKVKKDRERSKRMWQSNVDNDEDDTMKDFNVEYYDENTENNDDTMNDTMNDTNNKPNQSQGSLVFASGDIEPSKSEISNQLSVPNKSNVRSIRTNSDSMSQSQSQTPDISNEGIETETDIDPQIQNGDNPSLLSSALASMGFANSSNGSISGSDIPDDNNDNVDNNEITNINTTNDNNNNNNINNKDNNGNGNGNGNITRSRKFNGNNSLTLTNPTSRSKSRSVSRSRSRLSASEVPNDDANKDKEKEKRTRSRSRSRSPSPNPSSSSFGNTVTPFGVSLRSKKKKRRGSRSGGFASKLRSVIGNNKSDKSNSSVNTKLISPNDTTTDTINNSNNNDNPIVSNIGNEGEEKYDVPDLVDDDSIIEHFDYPKWEPPYIDEEDYFNMDAFTLYQKKLAKKLKKKKKNKSIDYGSSLHEETFTLNFAPTTRTSKTFKLSLAMSKEFGLTIDEIVPILEAAAPQSKLAAKLKEFLEIKMPQGFPVQLELPLYHILKATVTFQNFEEMKISDDIFDIPKDYIEVNEDNDQDIGC